MNRWPITSPSKRQVAGSSPAGVAKHRKLLSLLRFLGKFSALLATEESEKAFSSLALAERVKKN